jgi:signal transduction histidine kinase
MFLKKINKITNTLAFRLTLWYTIIFVLSSFAVFLLLYLSISTAIHNDMDDHLLEEIKEAASFETMQGMDWVKSLSYAEIESEGAENIFYRILDLNGEELFSTNMSSWRDVGVGKSALKQLRKGTNHVFETLSLPGRVYDVRIIYGHLTSEMILQIGKSFEEDMKFLGLFRRIGLIVIGPLIFLSAFIGWFMARHALTGVQEVTETALEISQGALEKRVQVKSGGYEIKRLVSVFNVMLEHINSLLKAMSEVTDNIAHDLKTPITRIRGIAESHLSAGGAADGAINFAADTVEECDSLLQMINTMLDITEIEAGISKIDKNQINIAVMIQKAVELFQPLAAEKGINIIVKGPDNIVIHGESDSLDRMIVNLLENAIKYTPPKGKVNISFDYDDKNRAVISFQDTGIGISDDDIPHLFKRLFRCDTSRSTPGFGLGLSLALAIVRAHEGDIIVSSQIGKGSTFKVVLP